MTVCTLIIAGICASNISSIRVFDTALGFSAEVGGSDFTAEIIAHSDNIKTPDWSRMNDACEGYLCFAYYKHCKQEGTRHLCEYHFSRPSDLQNTILKLYGKNREAIEAASRSFAVLPELLLDGAKVSISRMDVESPEPKPPYCDVRKGPKASCWPKPNER